MDDATNPLIPPVYEAFWIFAPVLALALAVVALVSIGRTAHRSLTELFVWLAIVLFVPVLGPIAWLLVRKSLPRPAA